MISNLREKCLSESRSECLQPNIHLYFAFVERGHAKASDPEGHKSRTSKERLFDFADRIETQTVHPSTHLGRMAEENGNLANCQGPIANDLKSNMWSFFSFSFVYSMRKKNQDMVVALVHKEMDGARALSESILFNYEVPSLGVAAWGLGFWSPQVLLIDLLGTCSQTSPALREQLFSQLPSWYESAKNMDGFHGWHKNTYPRRSRLSWTCLDCPHASCHLDEHLANQVKQLLQAALDVIRSFRSFLFCAFLRDSVAQRDDLLNVFSLLEGQAPAR